MTIWNLGSINIDHFYDVPHIPEPGETLAASRYAVGLGGKGANQSVAAARAGVGVQHIGAVGEDGRWALNRLKEFGVGARFVSVSRDATGHAIISVAADGENMIVLYGGANTSMPLDPVRSALAEAAAGDTLLLQNETAHQLEAARIGRETGMRVIYSAAPFDAGAVEAVLPHVSMLILNAVEAARLQQALGRSLADLPVEEVLVTKGADGAQWLETATGRTVAVKAIRVDPVDTTAAGDTFAGYLAAALDRGQAIGDAMHRASAAAALKVTRKGTADAIPHATEVDAFIEAQS